MNIALIMHELLVEGGGERQCVSLAQALMQQGHDVTVYTCAYDRSNCFQEICRDLKIIEVGRGHLGWLRKPLFIRGYLDMRHLTRSVATSHEIWNPHHWPAQWGAVWLKRKLGGAVIWMCNDVPNFYQKAERRKTLGLFRAAVHRMYYIYDRAQNRKADLTLLLSNWAECEFRRIYTGNTQVVRSGADPSRFAPGG
ncbi:MAG TPA: glycosyltransferase, partial [Candidatus Angelobacter sp.]|nr:glycosyltransferase [Candidatus Angelobacter sp.]